MTTLRNLLSRYREQASYLVFGVLTTVVSFVTAGIAKGGLELMGSGSDVVATVSTVFSWICAVTFAFVTNRRFVFRSQTRGTKAVLREGISFYGGRVSTLLFETAFMWVGNAWLAFPYWPTKLVANVVVLILNYVISKVFVFKQ